MLCNRTTAVHSSTKQARLDTLNIDCRLSLRHIHSQFHLICSNRARAALNISFQGLFLSWWHDHLEINVKQVTWRSFSVPGSLSWTPRKCYLRRTGCWIAVQISRCFAVYLKVQIQNFLNGTFTREAASFHMTNRLWESTYVKVLEGLNQIICGLSVTIQFNPIIEKGISGAAIKSPRF